MKYIIVLIFIYLNLYSQDFYLEVVPFKNNDNKSIGKCDIFIAVPYSILKFEKESNKFYSEFSYKINIFDSNDNIINSIDERSGIIINNYRASQGENNDFKLIQKKIELDKGNYKVECTIQDLNSNNLFKKSTSINILDYNSLPISMSGLLFLSSIEELNGKYKITPYLSNNLSKIKNGFFVFYEIYNNSSNSQFNVYYELKQKDGDKIYKGQEKVISTKNNVSQSYLYVNITEKMFGKYILKVTLSKSQESETGKFENEILAISEKEVDFTPSQFEKLIENIDLSIKQMKYVANIDFFDKNENKSQEEKIQNFLDFWQSIDPTPSTERNEALEEYFRRVNYANANYKSFSEGWLTDRGHTYIVFGEPSSISTNTSNYSTNETYEIWNYTNSTQFIFMDKTGLGDYRLIKPYSILQKYKYN